MRHRTSVKVLVVLLLTTIVLFGCGQGDQPAVEVTAESTPEAPPSSLIGQSIQEFPDDGLIDQNGEPVSIEALPKKPLVISFIYTRCPMQSMCPRVTENMVELQKRTNRAGEQPVHYVLVTFDPEYDRPEVLRQYADRFNINLDNFSLWTGAPSTVMSFIGEFKITVMKSNDGIKTHNMKTYLIDSDRVVRDMFRSSDWSPDEIQGPLMALVNRI